MLLKTGRQESKWHFRKNPIIGYKQKLPFNASENQSALENAKLQPAWHDWVLGPNIIGSGILNPHYSYNK